MNWLTWHTTWSLGALVSKKLWYFIYFRAFSHHRTILTYIDLGFSISLWILVQQSIQLSRWSLWLRASHPSFVLIATTIYKLSWLKCVKLACLPTISWQKLVWFIHLIIAIIISIILHRIWWHQISFIHIFFILKLILLNKRWILDSFMLILKVLWIKHIKQIKSLSIIWDPFVIVCLKSSIEIIIFILYLWDSILHRFFFKSAHYTWIMNISWQHLASVWALRYIIPRIHLFRRILHNGLSKSRIILTLQSLKHWLNIWISILWFFNFIKFIIFIFFLIYNSVYILLNLFG